MTDEATAIATRIVAKKKASSHSSLNGYELWYSLIRTNGTRIHDTNIHTDTQISGKICEHLLSQIPKVAAGVSKTFK